MTCVATNGKEMTADGRVCTGALIVSDEADKIFHAADGSVVGVAGDMSTVALIKRWFDDGEEWDCHPAVKRQDPDDTAFDALVLRPDGRVQFMSEHFTFVPYAVPAAIGSGSEIARAAMMCGKTPAEAVELAARCITTVGGKIRTLAPKVA